MPQSDSDSSPASQSELTAKEIEAALDFPERAQRGVMAALGFKTLDRYTRAEGFILSLYWLLTKHGIESHAAVMALKHFISLWPTAKNTRTDYPIEAIILNGRLMFCGGLPPFDLFTMEPVPEGEERARLAVSTLLLSVIPLYHKIDSSFRCPDDPAEAPRSAEESRSDEA